MTWTILFENWTEIENLIVDYFPHAGRVTPPNSLSDLTEFIAHLAQTHELTMSEAAELLDDLAMTAWANAHYTNEVPHKMVASS